MRGHARPCFEVERLVVRTRQLRAQSADESIVLVQVGLGVMRGGADVAFAVVTKLDCNASVPHTVHTRRFDKSTRLRWRVRALCEL
jgi:hypothetical protein